MLEKSNNSSGNDFRVITFHIKKLYVLLKIIL